MEKTDVRTLTDNFFKAISEEWMLVTAGNKDSFNMMTASWGGTGWLWGKPVAFVFVRPERHTHGFIEQNDLLTLSFLGDSKAARDAYNLCGTKSGRDIDKVAATGLTPVETPSGSVTFGQARLTLECRKLYKERIRPEEFLDPEIAKWYGGARGGYHDMYIVEIVNALK